MASSHTNTNNWKDDVHRTPNESVCCCWKSWICYASFFNTG
jgi:hypothetical protein